MKRFVLILSSLMLVGCAGNNPSSANPGSQNESWGVLSSDDSIFTIKFHTNGGNDIADLTVKAGEIPTRPADPVKEHSYFAGWFRDQWLVAEYYFDEPIQNSFDLYAAWSETPIASSEASTYIPPEDIVYKVTGLPNWIQNDGCVIFAWGWGGADFGAGKWASLEISGTEATFPADDEIDGFLLARCAAGTTTPSWDEKGDVPGRVYNQTENIAVTRGVFEYSCSNWFDYPKTSAAE